MQELTEKEFDQAVGIGTVLIDFSAEWCGPCKAMLPLVTRLSDEYGSKVRFYSVDIDKTPSIAARSGVMSVPTFLVYRDGAQVERIVGAVSEKELRKRIDSQLGS